MWLLKLVVSIAPSIIWLAVTCELFIKAYSMAAFAIAFVVVLLPPGALIAIIIWLFFFDR